MPLQCASEDVDKKKTPEPCKAQQMICGTSYIFIYRKSVKEEMHNINIK